MGEKLNWRENIDSEHLMLLVKSFAIAFLLFAIIALTFTFLLGKVTAKYGISYNDNITIGGIYNFADDYNDGMYESDVLISAMKEATSEELVLNDFVNHMSKEFVTEVKVYLLLNYGPDLTKEDVLYASPSILSEIRPEYCKYQEESINILYSRYSSRCDDGSSDYVSYRYDDQLLKYTSNGLLSDLGVSKLSGEDVSEVEMKEKYEMSLSFISEEIGTTYEGNGDS